MTVGYIFFHVNMQKEGKNYIMFNSLLMAVNSSKSLGRTKVKGTKINARGRLKRAAARAARIVAFVAAHTTRAGLGRVATGKLSSWHLS